MKRLSAVATAILLVTSAPLRADDAKDLEGAWAPTVADFAGTKFPDEVLKTMRLVIKGGTYSVTVGKQADRGTLKIAADKKPKEMDIVGTDGPNKGKTFLAVYELKGDELTICYDLGGKERPKEFKTQPKSMLFLVSYKRVKE